MNHALYLFFDGDCEAAITHYIETLGGEIAFTMRNSDAPDPSQRMPGGDDLIMHLTAQIGGMTVMASDTPPDMYSKPQGFRVQIEPQSMEEFDRIFNTLSKDAREIQMLPEESFWAERFTMFTDRFGTPWMMNYEGNKAQG
ncbi:MAG: glyoxalase/bleomycin resistance/extradiol dioxygenase family protein [Aquisalinus sp.]|nr:glyoxalase/bleomycin resistance/extradiol dioxygenase family protein [Aquisalinus sp.]